MGFLSGIFVKKDFTDPVCGMRAGEAIKAEHNGDTFHFCSEHCKEQFQQDPNKFINN